MDYYEGETLEEKISKKPLSIENEIDFTIQIALGLSKARSGDKLYPSCCSPSVLMA
jgi:hypothetical protein